MDAEELEDIRRIMAGTVITTNLGYDFLGPRNADTIIRALNSAGWWWVLNPESVETPVKQTPETATTTKSKRGRPKKPDKLTPAERAKRYRLRKAKDKLSKTPLTP